MPGGSTKKTCPFCQGILYCAQKVCTHCKMEQPLQQRLKTKLQRLDAKRQAWVVGRKKNHNIASIKNEAIVLLEKLHAIGYKPMLLLGRETKKKENKCEVFTPRCTLSTYAQGYLQKISSFYEYLCEGWTQDSTGSDGQLITLQLTPCDPLEGTSSLEEARTMEGEVEQAGTAEGEEVASTAQVEQAGTTEDEEVASTAQVEQAGTTEGEEVASTAQVEQAGTTESEEVASTAQVEQAGTTEGEEVASTAQVEQAGTTEGEEVASTAQVEQAGTTEGEEVVSTAQVEQASTTEGEEVASTAQVEQAGTTEGEEVASTTQVEQAGTTEGQAVSTGSASGTVFTVGCRKKKKSGQKRNVG
ncbi:hypothetical protein GJAV_G00037050 [Gymnothorax javanicus]|nr:hypothetical protein GJAV_G00037050 [Gymnothorax javanicus]